ncbi:MAG: hypothetical protein U0350_22170 [Caldilineaceae bacterium]
MPATVTVTSTIQSAPAIGAALRTMDRGAFHTVSVGLQRQDALVPMYHVGNHTRDQEAETAIHVISSIAERLRRLGTAYGEWDTFDAPAYFDLSLNQANHLVKVVERVNTVHVTFFADLLLPSFQHVVTYWAEEFAPVYQQLYQQPALGPHFLQEVQPGLVDRWQHLLAVIQQARRILTTDVGFLATNGGQEERERWRRWWQTAPAPGLDRALTPDLSQVPTLTLSFDFPLPASRQPDRLRRLRQNRERRRWRKKRNNSQED